MKQLVIVTVETPTCNPRNPFKKVFERQIQNDSSLSLSYGELCHSLRTLFGDKSVVVFRIVPYGKD